MKRMFRLRIAFLAVFFLLCFFSRGAFAAGEVAAPIAMTETVTLSKGGTLWAVFKAQQLPNKDWPKYWEEASRLSGIPHTDAAWRKLPLGKVITVPRDPRAIHAEYQQALSQLKTLSVELGAIEQHLAELDARLAALNRVLILAAASLFALCFVGVMVYGDSRLKNKETTTPSRLEASKEGDKPSLHIAPCCALPGDAPPSNMFSDSKPTPPRWHPT